METDLRHALDRGELCLYYQPMYTAYDNRQTAYEALSRWPHPGLGFVPPNQFIPLAEETGLIIRLGEWVLREACRQCRWWQEHGKPRVRVAVNVSPLQFARADFVDTVLGVLRDTGLTGEFAGSGNHRVHRDARYRWRNPKNGPVARTTASESR